MQKTIDDLPYHVWPIIFSNLSIDDLFNCRLINKKFKYFSDHTSILTRLFIGEYNYNKFFENKYCYNNKALIRKEDVFSLRCFKQFKLLSLFNLNKLLKHLVINEIFNDNEFNLKELSFLIGLEYLEIKNSAFNDDQYLELKNLKFFVNENSFYSELINLNVPKLEIIKLENMNYIQFQSNPESIKHLITTYHEDKLKIFKNLEIIEFRRFRSIVDLFNNFIKLKKIKFLDYDGVIHGRLGHNLKDNFENNLNQLLDEQTKLTNKIEIYFKDVKIEHIKKYKEFRSCENDLEYQIKNFDLLDSNLSTFKPYLFYDQLENCFNNLKNELPLLFFNKYSHLQNINIFKPVNNSNDLNWFLKNLKNLRGLHLKELFNQNFYDNLPNTISELFIELNKIKCNLDYNFILKLTNLIKFRTDDNVNLLELALNSFLNLKYLEEFKFKLNDQNIEIIKFKNKFNLIINSKNKLEQIDYKELVNLCNKIVIY